MEYTAMAEWLNTTFGGFDSAILDFMNTLALKAGGFLTPLMRVITFLGEKGIIFFLLAIGFMCFSKTRKLGVCIFGAVCCGALITNIILKDMVARPRPFETMAVYKSYWNYIGSPAESGFSFPSGHVTAAAAGMGAITLVRGKKWIVPSIIWVFLMCVSRNYLMAHFPSDVLFAAVIGTVSALIAYLITRAIFIYLEDNDDFPLCAAILDFDLPVRLPSKDSVAAVINRIDKGGSSRAGRAADGSKRTASRGGRRAGASESAAGGKRRGGTDVFKTVLNTGSGLIGKAGSKRAPADDDGESAPKREGASNWNSRWENYRNTRSGAGKQPDEPEAKMFTGAASPRPAAPRSARAEHTVDDMFALDEDADMKLAADDTDIKIAFDGDADVKIAVPRTKKPAAVGEFDFPESSAAPAPDDDIDWARLGIDFPGDLAADMEPEEPVRRRSSSRSGSSRSGSAYRGRHEK